MSATTYAAKTHRLPRLGLTGALLAGVAAVAACRPQPPDPQTALIAKGRDLFFNETFASQAASSRAANPHIRPPEEGDLPSSKCNCTEFRGSDSASSPAPGPAA